jgi:hypothetical protein
MAVARPGLLTYPRPLDLIGLCVRRHDGPLGPSAEVRGYPYKRSHLIALRRTKITASDPPSTWWPGI